MSEENVELVRRAYDAFNRGDLDGMVADLAPEFEYVTTGAVPGAGAGPAVEIARAVAALAGPGELLVSRTVRDLTAGTARRFEERGRHALAAAPGEWEVFLQLP